MTIYIKYFVLIIVLMCVICVLKQFTLHATATMAQGRGQESKDGVFTANSCIRMYVHYLLHSLAT